MRDSAILSTALLVAAVLVGCRTVWVHPEATAKKFDEDTFFCKYGIERSEWEPDPAEPTTDSERAWAFEGGSQPATVSPGWKRCMLKLGWDTSVSFRSAKPWRKPTQQKPRRYGGSK